VTALGGDNRYYTLNFLWWLRELIDWLSVAPGSRTGAAIRSTCASVMRSITGPYWRSSRATAHAVLRMKAPGSGILEFELEPLAHGGTRLTRRLLAPAWHLGAAVLVRHGPGAPVPVPPDDPRYGRRAEVGAAQS